MRTASEKCRNPLEAFLKPLILKNYRTIKDFANKLPFQRGTLFNILRGKCGLTNRYILTIAETLKIDAQELLVFHSGKHETPSLIPYEKPDWNAKPEKPETKIKRVFEKIIKSEPTEKVSPVAKIKRKQSTEAMQGSPEYMLPPTWHGQRQLDNLITGVTKPPARNTDLPDGLPDDGGCKYAVGKQWCNTERQTDSPYCTKHAAVCRANLHKK